MQKLKITKREIIFFFLGFLTFIILETVLDWDGTKKGFIEGWDEGENTAAIESNN